MTPPRATSAFAGFRFSPEVISLAVRWYLRYGLSYQDVEELLAERAIMVDHVTVYRWVQYGQVIDVMLSVRRDLAAARRFFIRALRAGTVTTDHAAVYPRVLDELILSALHTTERCANNPVEADHGRLKARLRPMRGLKRQRSARILAAGHAFVQNLRRGHYDIATEAPSLHRLRVAFDDLTCAI